MANHISLGKWVGSPSGLVDYMGESGSVADAAEAFLNYHNASGDSIVFSHIGGRAVDYLDGLELDLGLTKDQYENVFSGAWNGEKHTSGGYAKVWQVDARGYEKWIDNPDGSGNRTRIPVMEQAKTRAGNPRLDEDGNPILKQKMEYRHVAGYDFTPGLSKDRCERIVKNPELYPTYVTFMHKASDVVLGLLQDHVSLVKESVGPSKSGKSQGSATRMVKADGILWSSVVQCGSRPTPESDARLGGEGVVDPHLHIHNFIYAMARHGDGWKQIDGQEIFRNTEWLSAAFENEISRLEEEAGIALEYLPPTRKGMIFSRIKGSNPNIRKLLSTNTERAWRIKDAFMKKYGKAPNPQEYEREMHKTKGKKTNGAKEADLGGVSYWEKVNAAILEADQQLHKEFELNHGRPMNNEEREEFGLDLTITDIEEIVSRETFEVRAKTLYARLNAPDGITRDCDADAVFGPEKLIPAAFRASVGLGFTADEIKALAEIYLITELQLVRDAQDDSAKLYTTRSVIDIEQDNARWFERKRAEKGESVPEEIIEKIIAKYDLDLGQQHGLRLACSEERLVIITGPAGAGKGRLAKAIAEAHRLAEMVNIVAAFADAAKRGEGFGDDVDANYQGSIESLIRQVAKKSWIPSYRDLTFLDEAATVGTFRLRDVIKSTGNTKLIMFMDEMQLEAIGVAGWVQEQLPLCANVELQKVYRHSDEADKEAFDLIRQGKAHLGLANLSERNRLHGADSPEELVSVLMDRYRLHREAGRQAKDIAIIHQGANENLDVLNRFVQLDRLERGELKSANHITVDEESTGRRWMIYEGDRIIMNKAYWQRGTEPIRNGVLGTVIAIRANGDVRVQLDNKSKRVTTVKIRQTQEIQTMAPAYCVSTAKMQGDQIPVNLVVPGSPMNASLNSGYSQVTRAIDHVDIFIDKQSWGENPAKTLGQAWSLRLSKNSAMSFFEEAHIEAAEPPQWIFEEIDGNLYAKQSEEQVIEQEQITEREEARKRVAEMRKSFNREGLGLSL